MRTIFFCRFKVRDIRKNGEGYARNLMGYHPIRTHVWQRLLKSARQFPIFELEIFCYNSFMESSDSELSEQIKKREG